MWRENLFFGNLSEIFRTDGRKFFGRTTDGCTEIFRTDGRTDENFSSVRMGGNFSDGRTPGPPAGRTPERTDGRTKTKTKNSKCVSNDRSRRDDSESGRIVKIGAILKG